VQILKDSGKVSHEAAKAHAEQQFEAYETNRLALEAEQPSDFDELLEETKKVQKALPPPEPKKQKTRRRPAK
jgi:hypothetical protein